MTVTPTCDAMDVDELVRLVATEPARIVTRAVLASPIPPAGGTRSTDFSANEHPVTGHRRVHYGHVLGEPAAAAAIDAWQRAHPSHPLPDDLRALVSRIDGIHLWADLDSGRSYTGLAPIAEWELARTKMFGSASDPALLDERYVAISYHLDFAAFVVLDVDSQRYFLMDAAGPDTTSPVGRSVPQLLDFLWRTRIPPK